MTAQQAREILVKYCKPIETIENIEQLIEEHSKLGISYYYTKQLLTKEQKDYFVNKGFSVRVSLADSNRHRISW